VKSFRLYRAVSRIALQADARIVAIFIGGARRRAGAYAFRLPAWWRWFPRLRIAALPAMTMAELAQGSGAPAGSASNALFDRVAEARLAAYPADRSLFGAIRDAADRFGSRH